MSMHFAGTPVSFMTKVHYAAATQNFIALDYGEEIRNRK